MCVDNAIETFSLAHKFDFDNFADACGKYIANIIELIPKSKLKETATADPFLFNEIFEHCIAKYGQNLKLFYEQFQEGLSTQLDTSDSDCLRDYEEMFNRQIFTDVDLEVDGKILKAHKLILSSKI